MLPMRLSGHSNSGSLTREGSEVLLHAQPLQPPPTLDGSFAAITTHGGSGDQRRGLCVQAVNVCGWLMNAGS